METVEIELKFRSSDWGAVLGKLATFGAEAKPVREDVDHYFNAPDRDFGQTDEVVRLRIMGERNCLTYKGPKAKAAVKTRREIEIDLRDGQLSATQAVCFLTALGYRPTAVVSKTRQVYTFDRDGFHIEICFDDAGAIGKFVEVEIVATTDRADEARTKVAEIAAELGLTEIEHRSYLRMLLEQHPKAEH